MLWERVPLEIRVNPRVKQRTGNILSELCMPMNDVTLYGHDVDGKAGEIIANLMSAQRLNTETACIFADTVV